MAEICWHHIDERSRFAGQQCQNVLSDLMDRLQVLLSHCSAFPEPYLRGNSAAFPTHQIVELSNWRFLTLKGQRLSSYVFTDCWIGFTSVDTLL